ncbi:MAG: signal peptide peptidase SppA [Bacteroidia bacterium]|jgi:protease-4|nr:signal peptide peptidase SppA [Bacteroidia bacterium]
MKQFFKFLFASMLGTILSIVVLFFVLIGIVAAFAGSSDEETKVKSNSILSLHLNYEIDERTNNDPFQNFDFASMEGSSNAGLNDILKSIRHAATDENIKGIYIDIALVPNSYATLKEIRDELIAFKQSKKFIYAYGEIIEEHGYYIASVADSIFITPTGTVLLDGFAYTSTYIKGMLDKIGVQAELIRHGKFKAAGEPFIANEMSAENRKQIESFMGTIYQEFIVSIAKARKIEPAVFEDICNQLKVQRPEDAVAFGLINGLKYRDEMEADLKKLSGIEESADLEMVSIGSYKSKAREGKLTAKDKIAVIYAVGEIVDGDGGDGQMGSKPTAEAIAKARKDTAVKAVVLRVNSPGGSALASDIIWREVVLTKKVKPVIVSMGALAASGGYYIAAPADMIVAEPNTITGSIGVFGMFVNAQNLLNNKLGLKFEKVKFGEYSDLGSPDRPMTAAEKAIMQKMIDRIYDDFISRVAEGRSLTKAQVDSIAQGHVWAGRDALGLGLVDTLGGLADAVAIAVKKANLTEYRIMGLPEQKDPFEKFIKSFGNSAQTYWLKQQLGDQYPYFEQFKNIQHMHGIKARMLWDGKIE